MMGCLNGDFWGFCGILGIWFWLFGVLVVCEFAWMDGMKGMCVLVRRV